MRACDTPSLTQNVSLGVQSPDPSCRRTKVEGERRNKQADCANLCVCLREVCVCVWGAGGVFVCVHVSQRSASGADMFSSAALKVHCE